jgi:hypothetical protein
MKVTMSKSLSMLRKTLWGSLLVGLLGPLAASAQAPAGTTSPSDGKQSERVGKARPDALSPDEKKAYHEDRKYVRSLAKPDVPTSLDYSDPRVYRFVVARLKQAGKTPETAPRLFEHINQRRAAGKQPSPTTPSPTTPSPTTPSPTTPSPTTPSPTKTELTTISPPRTELTQTSLTSTELTQTSLTRTSFPTSSLITASTMAAVNARARQHFITSANFVSETSPYIEANALVTYPGGANYLYVDSTAWDNNGTPLGEMGHAEKYAGSTARSAAIGDITKTTALDYEVDSYALTDTASGLQESYVVRYTTRKCQFNLSTLTISAPVNKTGGECIDVCLSTTSTSVCDYSMAATPTALKLPLKGSITLSDCTFNATKISAYKAGTQTPTGDIKLVLNDVGGGCDMSSTTTPMRSFWQGVTLSNTNKTLTWNLSGTTAASFDSSCRQVQDYVELDMSVDLPMLKGSTSVIRPLSVSNSIDTQASNYTLPCMSMVR